MHGIKDHGSDLSLAGTWPHLIERKSGKYSLSMCFRKVKKQVFNE